MPKKEWDFNFESEKPNPEFQPDMSLENEEFALSLYNGFLKINPVGKVYYIRERRCKFPGPKVWKATNRSLQLFRDNGGTALRLNQAQVAAWYALVFMYYKVVDGDLTLMEDNNRLRTISPDEFTDFIRDNLHSPESLSFVDMDKTILKPRMDKLKYKRHKKLSVLIE